MELDLTARRRAKLLGNSQERMDAIRHAVEKPKPAPTPLPSYEAKSPPRRRLGVLHASTAASSLGLCAAPSPVPLCFQLRRRRDLG